MPVSSAARSHRVPWAERLTCVSSKTLLAGMLTLFTIAGGVLSFLTIWSDYRGHLAQAEVNVRNVSHLLEEHVMRTIQSSDQVMRRVKALMIRSNDGPWGITQATWLELRNLELALPEAGTIKVFDPQGRLVLWSEAYPAPAFDGRELPYVREHLNGQRDLLVGPLEICDLTGAPVFTISRQLVDARGALAGVVVIAIKTQTFTNFHERVNLGPHALLAILHTDGELVLRQPFDARLIKASRLDSPLFQEHLRQASTGTFRGLSVSDGVDRINAYRKLPQLPLAVVAAVAVKDALEPWRWHARRSFLFGGAALLMLGGLAVLTLRSMRREEASWLAVQQAIDTLREANEGLEQRVEERTAQLSIANDRLIAALIHKDMLLKEVNHRVKNSLQMISSLLTLQSGTVADPDIRHHLTEACSRVATVAQIHQRLYETAEFKTVEFAGFLHSLCNDLAASLTKIEDGLSIEVSADAVDMAIDVAIPLALIANELVTNALKYAYPSGRGGRVTVAFQTLAGGRRQLAVADRGVGLPPDLDPTRQGNLGMQVLMTLVAQLDADLDVDRTPPGTRFTITLPLEA